MKLFTIFTLSDDKKHICDEIKVASLKGLLKVILDYDQINAYSIYNWAFSAKSNEIFIPENSNIAKITCDGVSEE